MFYDHSMVIIFGLLEPLHLISASYYEAVNLGWLVQLSYRLLLVRLVMGLSPRNVLVLFLFSSYLIGVKRPIFRSLNKLQLQHYLAPS